MTGRKVRTKKLNIKTLLPVLREDQIDPAEYDALTTETQIATGVEQAEENEYHLQSILKDAGTSNDQEIPVPPPQESDIDFDQLYQSNFSQPSSYIRFSSTVEECISCHYDMTTEDDEFLRRYNGDGRASSEHLSEDDFERIMDVYESTSSEHTPFASVDNTVIPYDLMVPSLNQLGSAQVMQHAKAIYDHWSSRRQELGNKSLHPSLKFEMHQDSDDTDPYVCFRRREARQTRKTRARDVQMAEKVKRLRRELEDGRQLAILSYEREMVKREFLLNERHVFERRARLKSIKVQLGIRAEDEDLINQKPKRKAHELPPLARQQQRPSLPIALRPDGRSMEADLVQLADKIADKENEIMAELEAKLQAHRSSNKNYVDLTWRPLSPAKEETMEQTFRPAKTQYLMTPPASDSSDSMDVDEEGSMPLIEDKGDAQMFEFAAGGGGGRGQELVPTKQPAFRRRIGRLNRLWIDRRGIGSSPVRGEANENSDRWKYDQDDDEEPVFELDPFDTRCLKFRAMIPLSPWHLNRKLVPQIQTQLDASGAVSQGPSGHRIAAPPTQSQGRG